MVDPSKADQEEMKKSIFGFAKKKDSDSDEDWAIEKTCEKYSNQIEIFIKQKLDISFTSKQNNTNLFKSL